MKLWVVVANHDCHKVWHWGRGEWAYDVDALYDEDSGFVYRDKGKANRRASALYSEGANLFSRDQLFDMLDEWRTNRI